MHVHRLVACSLAAVGLATAAVAKDDALTTITRSFRTSPCVRIAFEEIVHSQVFDKLDTLKGLIVFDSSGCYRIELGEDIYVRTDSELYSFSPASNQVIIEKLDDSSSMVSVLWIRHLDDYFESTILVPDKRYRLTAKPGVSVDVPASLTLFVSGGKRIEKIEFIDDNGDSTMLKVVRQETSQGCRKDDFEPDFPDSVERVRL